MGLIPLCFFFHCKSAFKNKNIFKRDIHQEIILFSILRLDCSGLGLAVWLTGGVEFWVDNCLCSKAALPGPLWGSPHPVPSIFQGSIYLEVRYKSGSEWLGFLNPFHGEEVGKLWFLLMPVEGWG